VEVIGSLAVIRNFLQWLLHEVRDTQTEEAGLIVHPHPVLVAHPGTRTYNSTGTKDKAGTGEKSGTVHKALINQEQENTT
jgi:hypothetical protein